MYLHFSMFFLGGGAFRVLYGTHISLKRSILMFDLPTSTWHHLASKIQRKQQPGFFFGVRHLGHVCQAFAQRKLSALLGQLRGEGCHLLKSMELTSDFQKFIEFSAWKFFKALEGKCDRFFVTLFRKLSLRFLRRVTCWWKNMASWKWPGCRALSIHKEQFPNTHA